MRVRDTGTSLKRPFASLTADRLAVYAYIPSYPEFCSDGPGAKSIYCHSEGFGGEPRFAPLQQGSTQLIESGNILASIHRGAFTFEPGRQVAFVLRGFGL